MPVRHYRVIETDDGSPSLYSGEYGEAMHSTSGAYQESLLKHVLPSGILSSTKERLNVLDIGCGIGLNILALAFEFLKINSASRLSIVTLERSFDFLPLLDPMVFGDDRDHLFELIKECMRVGTYSSPGLDIRVLRGDARQTIQSIRDVAFNAVFHDPFSPAKNPELWSVEFFTEVRRLIDPEGVLTTYSSALQIRAALLEAGFRIGRGPSVGAKREGTLASVRGAIPFFSEEELFSLKGDYRSIPYRDPDLRDLRGSILERRRAEIQAKKDPPVHR